jgi:hypothetical protein
MSMTVDELIQNFSGKEGLTYGVDTAIKALRPGAKWDLSVAGGQYTFTRWEDPEGRSFPHKEEIEKELEFQKQVAEYYQYAYDRTKEYPDGYDQLDMLWHAINNGVELKNSEWFQKIKEVKEKHPKPEGEPPTKDE